MMRTRLLSLALAGTLICAPSAPVMAHPHMHELPPMNHELLEHVSPGLFQFLEPWQLLIPTPPIIHPKNPAPPRLSRRHVRRDTSRTVTVAGVNYVRFPHLPWRAEAVVNIALAKQGVPYVYGASPDQIVLTSADCSSFLVYVFRRVGVYLPRVSWAQLNSGDTITPDRALPGDIIGFYGEGGAGGHVGLYIGNGYFIHAPQSGDVIRVQKLSDGPQVWKFVRVLPELNLPAR